MINALALEDYLNQLLSVADFKDYSPPGLQVAGGDEIHKIVTGVTASQRLLDAAISKNADAIIVHHGYFWRGENPQITGLKRQRIAHLLANNVNLYAYHLPLDCHTTYGNNKQLAARLALQSIKPHAHNGIPNLIWTGKLASALTARDFSKHISQALNRTPLHIEARPDASIKTIAWCSGAAQGYIEQAARFGVDAYLSGEISEPTVHAARELGIEYFACGHHATERYGVKALGEHLAHHFGLDVEFIDCDNPV